MISKAVIKILGFFLAGFTGALLIPLAVALYFQFMEDPSLHPQNHASLAFLATLGISAIGSAGCLYFGKSASFQLSKKEAVLSVAMIWVLTPALAALPFIFSGTLNNPIQAYFEAASGLSTTGATVLQAKAYDTTGQEIALQTLVREVKPASYTFYGNIDPIRNPLTGQIVHEGVEAVSKALLFWRSFIQWLGGLGIIVLFVAILPNLGMSGKILFQSEITGPWKEDISPRVGRAAFYLWAIYLALTLVLGCLLMLFGLQMDWFEATTTALSTLSGGGFSIYNTGISSYDSAAIDWILIVFMILSATNFTLFYHILKGKFFKLYQPELFYYLALLFLSCCLGSWLLVGTEKVILDGPSGDTFSISEAIRYGSFQVVSALTTVGLSNADYDHWPYGIQVMILMLMFIGGMSGSTASGSKIIRVYVLFHVLRDKLQSLFRIVPVRRFNVGSQEVDINVINATLTYLLLVVVIAAAAVFVYVLNGIDPETALSLTASFMNNTGMGFRAAGPTHSFAFLSNGELLMSSLLMIMGRLEFFVILAVVMPSFWMNKGR